MRGATLHAAGGIASGVLNHDKNLSHGDVDILLTRTQSIRCILIDEVWQIASDLFGAFALHFEDAAIDSIYKTPAMEQQYLWWLQPFGVQRHVTAASDPRERRMILTASRKGQCGK